MKVGRMSSQPLTQGWPTIVTVKQEDYACRINKVGWVNWLLRPEERPQSICIVWTGIGMHASMDGEDVVRL